MPGPSHERLIEMFQQRPEFAPELLGQLGVAVPAYDHARLDSTNASETVVTEYRSDATVVLTSGIRPLLAVVVEIQLGRDPAKRWSWPVYLANLRARLECPVQLLVVCLKRSVAAWCAQPIDLGHPGFTLTPLVLGPDSVPVVDDREMALRHPELTMLSAVAHAESPVEEQVFRVSLDALESLDHERTVLYHEFLWTALPKAARHRLEDLVYELREYHSPFARELIQGRLEGESDALLAVLAARGLDVPREVRDRIRSATDVEQLRKWISRAAVATSLDDVFVPA
jgi:hypothetical protein